MKVILVGKNHGRTLSYTLSSWSKALLSVCLLGIPVGLGALLSEALQGDHNGGVFTEDVARNWEKELRDQKQQLERTRQDAEAKISAVTLRLSQLQARMLRLDALGERLTSIAKLEEGEFDFSQPPALGGPESIALESDSLAPDFAKLIEQLADQIEDREVQLETLESLLAKRDLQRDRFVGGRPVKWGWVSSPFGKRTDPFKGHASWHSGVDFAGKLGSDIIAVAGGVVTWSGERQGYGQMVEVNHGGGIATRYAHNTENLVKVGEVVKKGQVLALMGSSGRSTGPHVHFEVYKNGRAVDPASYIRRTIR